jgi:anti-anti-sigma regulatory factor
VGAESLLNKIQSDLKVGKRTFYIDFTAVDSLDEQGIEPLLQGLKIITDTGGQGYLLSLNDEVRSLFVSRDLHLILNVLP